MNKKDKKNFREFYLNNLLDAFPSSARSTILCNYSKHLYEVSLIIDLLDSMPNNNPKIIDIGGGLGINTIILSKLFSLDCTVVDRFDEFADSLDRAVGNDKQAIERMESFGVKVIREDFINNGFPKETKDFDLVTCFSVIEHFNFSPKKLINSLALIVNENGKLVLSTPNQVHLFNRIKALVGRNTWEDFDSFYSSDPFFGHIREFTKSEMKQLIDYSESWRFVKIESDNYPIDEFADRLKFRNSRISRFSSLLKLLSFFTFTHSLKMHLFVIGEIEDNR